MAKGSITSTTAQIRTSSRLRVKSRENHAHHSNRVHQDQPRSAKKLRTIIPAPQSTRIVGRFIAGESVRSIARAENRDRATVARIVAGSEIRQYIDELRGRFFGALECAMETLLEELKNPVSKTRGALALEMLKHGGVVPNRNHMLNLESQSNQPEESEDAAIERIAIQIVKGAIHKHKAFGIPLPEADEAEQALIAKANHSGEK